MYENEKFRLIDLIADAEWKMFQDVNNIGGRADCQDNRHTFDIMRKSQFSIWNEKMLKSYLDDLLEAQASGRNLIMEKYAYMMEKTEPEYFNAVLKKNLPVSDFECESMISEICWYFLDCEKDFVNKYPKLAAKGRPVSQSADRNVTSVETYLLGELKTYSKKTLANFLEFVRIKRAKGENLLLQIQEETVKKYGYADLTAVEERA